MQARAVFLILKPIFRRLRSRKSPGMPLPSMAVHSGAFFWTDRLAIARAQLLYNICFENICALGKAPECPCQVWQCIPGLFFGTIVWQLRERNCFIIFALKIYALSEKPRNAPAKYCSAFRGFFMLIYLSNARAQLLPYSCCNNYCAVAIAL